MHAILARIHARFASRPDSEHGQALVRIAVLSVVLLYLLLSRAHGSNEANHQGYLLVLGMVAFGFTIGAMLLGWIFLRPGVSHLRRPRLARLVPVHVTIRVARHVYNPRSKRAFSVIGRALGAAAER